MGMTMCEKVLARTSGRDLVRALKCKGIEYIEIRSIDLNPFERAGISIDQLYFLHAFIIYNLILQDKQIHPEEMENIRQNDKRIALAGRKNDLKVFDSHGNMVSVQNRGKIIFKDLFKIAELIAANTGNSKYAESIGSHYNRFLNKNSFPSSRIMELIESDNSSHIRFGLNQARKHMKGGMHHELYIAGI